jgi:hypothetical protein
MTDQNTDDGVISPELESVILDDYRDHQIELRRSAEICSGFAQHLLRFAILGWRQEHGE